MSIVPIIVLTAISATPISVIEPLDAASPPFQFVLGELEKACEDVSEVPTIRIATHDAMEDSPKFQSLVPEKPEGFVFCPAPDRNAFYVIGRDVRGALYGTLWLADRLKVEGPRVFKRVEGRAPVFRYRDHVDLGARQVPPNGGPEDIMKRNLRFTLNTQIIGWARPYVFLNRIDPQLVDNPETHEASVKSHRKRLREDLERIDTWHLDAIASCGPFLDMPDLDRLIAVYGDEVSEDGSTLSPALDKPWDIWREMQSQVLEDFPQIDGLRSSLQDFAQRYQICAARGPKAEALGKAGAMRRFVQTIRQAVVVEHHGRAMMTTWGNPPDTYVLNDPIALRTIFEGIPTDGLILHNNECEHDFYLISPFNDNFGVTDVPKGIMFQAQREYEGQGHIPVYIGRRMHERMMRCVRLGETETAEARLWRSDNLYDPLCWTWANLYAFMRACWAPDGDPWEWARDYCILRFGRGGAELLADALMMTEEVARRTFYVTAFSGAKRDAYAITHRCVFTDGRHYYQIVADPHAVAYQVNHVRGKVPQFMEQAEQTRQLSRAMVERAREASIQMRSAGIADALPVLESFEHFHSLVEILTHYQQAMVLWYYKDERSLTSHVENESRALCAFHAREALDCFKSYREKYDLYKDGGMVPLLRRYLKQLGDSPERIAPYHEIRVPITNEPFKIDGDINEKGWPESQLILDTDIRSGEKVAERDFRVEFRLAMTNRGLGIAAKVTDSELVPIRIGRVFRSDSIGLSFDTNDDGREDAIYYFLVDHKTGDPVLLTVMRDMILGSRDYEDRHKAAPVDPDAKIALRKTDGEYSWECMIPWSMLGDFDPGEDTPLGIFFTANDVDTSGGGGCFVYPPTPEWRDPPPPAFAYSRE